MLTEKPDVSRRRSVPQSRHRPRSLAPGCVPASPVERVRMTGAQRDPRLPAASPGRPGSRARTRLPRASEALASSASRDPERDLNAPPGSCRESSGGVPSSGDGHSEKNNSNKLEPSLTPAGNSFTSPSFSRSASCSHTYWIHPIFSFALLEARNRDSFNLPWEEGSLF